MTVRSCAIFLFLSVVPAAAQVTHTPVLGTFELTALTVSCPAMPSGCYTCVNDEPTTGDTRLMLALGASFPNLLTTGEAEGVLRPFVEIDGVRLTPDLFPCGAVLRSGLAWLDRPFARSCGDTPVSATYRVGTAPEVTVSGDGSTEIFIAASEAQEISFRFEVCSELVYWGTGCGIAGSAANRFELRMPGHLDAIEVAAGDAAAVSIGTSELSIDFVDSPGGVVSVSRVRGDVPDVDVPAVPHLDGYWDVHTDLVRGTFVADLAFEIDAASLPPHVNPAGVVVAIYDADSGAWRPLTTDVDVTAGTAIVRTDHLSKFVLVESAVVSTQPRSWGAVKAAF